MDRKASGRLIIKVVFTLVAMVGALFTLMAARAGMIELSPGKIFMGMFLLIVGGALLHVVQEFISSDHARPQEDAIAARPEGGN